MTTTLVVTCGMCFGLGVAGTVVAWRRGPPGEDSTHLSTDLLAGLRSHLALLLLSGALGVLFGLITGWPVAVPIVGIAVYGLPRLFGKTTGSASIAKIESIAVWTEMLQGTLAASAGLSQAIVATAPLSPPAIRGATMRLSGRLGAGMHPCDALALFADELEDPSADRVVCALQLAVSSRAQRLGDLLMALADSTRDEVALRLRIETSRASLRSGVRTVLVFSVAFAVGLALLARAYLAPFGSPTGQFVLMAVGVLYGFGLTLMVSLARPPAPVRLLGRQVIEP
jgi:Flp pilus assembly protein TadB